MIAIPAVCLYQGRCIDPSAPVRLRLTGDEPGETVQKLVRLGFSRVHVEQRGGIDLSLARRLLAIDDVTLQLDVGNLTDEFTESLLEHGARSLVAFVATVGDIESCAERCSHYPGAIVLAIEAQQRRTSLRRWSGQRACPVIDLVEELRGLPLGGILISAVGDDGLSDRPDLGLLQDLVEATSFPLVAACVCSFETLSALQERGVAGALIPFPRSEALDLLHVATAFAQ